MMARGGSTGGGNTGGGNTGGGNTGGGNTGGGNTGGGNTGGGNTGELVVVGVDGSAQSVAALRWAARYAEALGATIRAVRAWHFPAAAGLPPVGRAPRPVTDEVRQEMQDQLDGAIAQVYPQGPPDSVQTGIVYGHAAPALIEESRDADLLVVGNKGHGAFTGMLVGSVSLHCVTAASCPVVVVHGTGRPPQAAR